MLDYTAKSYGDGNFTTRAAGRDNRLEALRGTDLLIQSALVPNSRIRRSNADESSSSDNDGAVYIGPKDTGTIYTVPISAAYIISASGTSYRHSTESLQGDMDVGIAQTPSQFSFEDWEDFYLYPAEVGTVHIEDFAKIKNSLSQAFGGGDSTVTQVAAISSAFPGPVSPLVGSSFSQFFSKARYDLLEPNGTAEDNTLQEAKAKIALFDGVIAKWYDQPLFDKFAVCNQWHNTCGATDSYYIDGAYVDNPSLVIYVAQFQMSSGDLKQTLKVILTNTNEVWGTAKQFTQILQYFKSPINQGVEPGSFNWPPGYTVPYQSPQIFEEFLDSSTLDDLLKPIPDSNMTTAILKGTNINNPIFGVKAGQSVEILLVNLNDPII